MDRRALQSQLPKGVKIYLPDEAARKRFVEERLLRVFGQWGFREVGTPTYEYFDVLSLGTDLDLQERMLKLVDRETGRMLALRADITPQIARIVATRLRDEPKPLRLAYVANVFRYDESIRDISERAAPSQGSGALRLRPKRSQRLIGLEGRSEGGDPSRRGPRSLQDAFRRRGLYLGYPSFRPI